MIVTINTDASYSNKFKVGAFAFWIVCNQGKVCRAGPLKGEIKDCHTAELMAITNALFVLSEKVKSGQIGRITKVIINTDSLRSIQILTGDKEAYYKYNLNRPYYKVVKTKFKGMKKKFFDGVVFDYRHVRAHTSTDTARSWVNDWCDKSAKEELGKILSTLK